VVNVLGERLLDEMESGALFGRDAQIWHPD
jgi:hypothetical protein